MFYFYAQKEEKTHILQELNKIKKIEESITKINSSSNFGNPNQIREKNDLEWEKMKIEYDLKEYKKNYMEKMKNSNDKNLIEQYKREEKIENKILEIKNSSVWVNLEYEVKLKKEKQKNKEITIDKIEKILEEVEIYKIERKI